MPVLLSDQRAAILTQALDISVQRTGRLQTEQPNHTLVTRLFHDAQGLKEFWESALADQPTMPNDSEADIADLVEGIQVLLPSASVQITVPSRPRSESG